MSVTNKMRQKYIGSSDARDIMYSNWSHLFEKKSGLCEPDDLSDNFPVQLGIATEDFHIEWTTQRIAQHDFPCHAAGKQGFYKLTTHNGTPLGAHTDAILVAGNARYVLEVKHSMRFSSAVEAAEFYMPQLQHLMICTRKSVACLSVIIGNKEPDRAWIEADQDYQNDYIRRCDEFWRLVESRSPPHGYKPVEEKRSHTDQIKINGMTRRSLEHSNHAQELIDKYIINQPAAVTFNKVKSELKALMSESEAELYHPKLTLKRNARGAILIKQNKESSDA